MVRIIPLLPPILVNNMLNTNTFVCFLDTYSGSKKEKQRAQNLCYDIHKCYQACVAIPFANSSLFECKYLNFLSI